MPIDLDSRLLELIRQTKRYSVGERERSQMTN